MKAAGFSLIEVIVATTILMTGVASLAQLIAWSARANDLARSSSAATLLAQQKVEALRAGASELSPSPAGALLADTPGYSDYLDSRGAPLETTTSTPPAGTVFVRRWSIDMLPGSVRDTVVLQVVVIRWSESRAQGWAAAHLVTAAARRGG
jgi:type II secretory pathway pseudopilin PulG